MLYTAQVLDRLGVANARSFAKTMSIIFRPTAIIFGPAIRALFFGQNPYNYPLYLMGDDAKAVINPRHRTTDVGHGATRYTPLKMQVNYVEQGSVFHMNYEPEIFARNTGRSFVQTGRDIPLHDWFSYTPCFSLDFIYSSNNYIVSSTALAYAAAKQLCLKPTDRCVIHPGWYWRLVGDEIDYGYKPVDTDKWFATLGKGSVFRNSIRKDLLGR